MQAKDRESSLDWKLFRETHKEFSGYSFPEYKVKPANYKVKPTIRKTQELIA
jgi:hypothetical protein